MKYEGVVYRPPSEFDSLIVQATIGCPHNRCIFCNMYSDRNFRIRPVSEIKEDLEEAMSEFGDCVKKIFFADGNTILMKTDELLDILRFCRDSFPNLKSVTMYGSAQYILLKSQDELNALKSAGLSRIHSGMESGDDEVLRLIDKGYTAEQMARAGRMVKSAGIELSVYFLCGVGGKKLSRQHALNSAKIINLINPDFIRLRTLMPFEGTRIYDMYKSGEFELLSPHEALFETRLLVEHLNVQGSQFLSDHVSNYENIKGVLPGDREKMLDDIDEALELDPSEFRSPEKGVL
ncbi:Radical SAM superfamily protein [Peptoclostridium litorale DSM 5388]|uniref:Radical SAM domain-containing protein n=1 Tax=Peptoclostridium litorale DSM 5388 TaxID=1121324 RepID=A0A069RJI3_PEPLI|nr:radical SAM protein [Peptoclostridium litorale]KDR96310.1 radical SAM domain-containing protein [Peptoclostridium litorale DSM 5388]SIO26152.1 Radical SAM superfamily protein [Peptoclostridium litorale DSM 5388]